MTTYPVASSAAIGQWEVHGTAGPLRPSAPLYDALAADYEQHFAAPHRRLYDELAWERVTAFLNDPSVDGGPVVDAGCGIGRWARPLAQRGHVVIGVEHAPTMLHELRSAAPIPGFRVVEGSIDTLSRNTVVGPHSSGAQLVLAMGSVQYTQRPASTISNLASWLRPGGVLAVLVDSLVGLVLELIGDGREAEAAKRLATGRGVWRIRGREADLHLLDRDQLVGAFAGAGLEDITASGLLVTAAALGKGRLQEVLEADFDECLATERRWADDPRLADVGKQLLVTGRLPTT